MSHRDLTCIRCPLGCTLTVSLANDVVTGVRGNNCQRGVAYAHDEVMHPTRTLTTTVAFSGGTHPVLPVKSSIPLPKDQVFPCVQVLKSITLSAPVEAGAVVVSNILNTGADIITTAQGIEKGAPLCNENPMIPI